MEIKIDLNDLLGEEFGSMENLAKSIEHQVITTLTKELAKGIKSRIDETIAEIIHSKVKDFAESKMPELFEEIIDKPYEIVDSYGSKKGITTMRNQLIKTLTEQMVYKPCSYNSEKNYFTKNIDKIVAEYTDAFKKDFNAKVNKDIVSEAFAYAYDKLQRVFRSHI